ncbi:MAG: nitrogenase component 1, partial [Oscillospiraceae bacterium]|nr:nitrogenase component 1 [Oscillospiraceae bacterium]
MNGAAHYEKLKRPPIREKRIGGINAYYGKISDLIEEFESSGGVQRVRTYTQTLEDELTYAIRALLTLRGGVLVVHGPRGCAMAVFAAVSVLGRGRTYPCLARCYSTDLSEKDSIMGSEKKLRDAVRRACEEHRPKHIFILTTPVVAINNDDVISAAREMSEQLGVRILPVFTDGFKSRMPQTGSDYAFHAIFGMLRGARGGTAAGKESGTAASGGESRIPAGAESWRVSVAAVNTSAEDMDELIRMLQEAGIEAEPFFKAMNETDEKGGLVLPEAELFLCVGPEETGYFAECLNSDAAARALSVAPPVGLEGSR